MENNKFFIISLLRVNFHISSGSVQTAWWQWYFYNLHYSERKLVELEFYEHQMSFLHIFFKYFSQVTKETVENKGGC